LHGNRDDGVGSELDQVNVTLETIAVLAEALECGAGELFEDG